jgi:polysaccharide export outer membrane protein
MRTWWLCVAFVLGCGGSRTYNWAAERAAGYKVGAGDVVKINVWKHDELSQQVTVRPDGALTMPLIGDVKAEGKTVEEIGVDIGQRVHRYFQDQPPVTVQIAEVRSYKVYVVGEVQRGGEFTPNHQISVLHGLALAGGFTRFANADRIVIVRKDARGERRIPFDYSAVVEHGDLQQNLALQSGDTVVVP